MVGIKNNARTSPRRLLILAVGAVALVLVALLVYMMVSPSAPFAGIPD
jgi:hypothetical protein